MITTTSIRQAFRSRNNPEDWVIVAHAIWRISLTFASILVVAGILFGIWNLLYALGVRNPAPVVTDVPSETVSREQLSEILELYETRAVLFEERRRATPNILDVSELGEDSG
jgi:hypothetical protein